MKRIGYFIVLAVLFIIGAASFPGMAAQKSAEASPAGGMKTTASSPGAREKSVKKEIKQKYPETRELNNRNPETKKPEDTDSRKRGQDNVVAKWIRILTALIHSAHFIKFLIFIALVGIGGIMKRRKDKQEKKLAEEKARQDEIDKRYGKIY